MSHAGHNAKEKVLTNPQLAEVYWIFAGGVIVIASLVNLGDKLIHRQRCVVVSTFYGYYD